MQNVSSGRLDRRRSISDQVYEHLRRMIVMLELRPSEPVPESEVSLSFEVSRTPVREALLRLANEGLVVIVPQYGTFVAAIDPDAVRQAQFLRENLEVAVGLRLCGKEPLDLSDAHDLLARQQVAARTDDYASFVPLDDSFHQSLFEAAGVGQVWSVIQATKAQLDRIRFLHTPEPGKLEEVIAQHTAILEAIEARDRARTEAHYRRHTSGVLDYLKHLQATRSELFEPLKLTRQRRGANGTQRHREAPTAASGISD